MKRPLLFVTVICLSLAALSSGVMNPSDNFLSINSVSSVGSTSLDTFKNLKILPKDITPHDLDSIMKGFTIALKVDCGFCHVKSVRTGEWNYSSDRKHEKEEAREMMTMTYAINQKYFNFNEKKVPDQTVTCMTCHNQKVIPERVQW